MKLLIENDERPIDYADHSLEIIPNLSDTQKKRLELEAIEYLESNGVHINRPEPR